MTKDMHQTSRALAVFVVFCLVIPACFAQMVGERDLTKGWSVPAEHVPGPPGDTCPNIKYSVSDSDKNDVSKVSRPEAERLELQILEVFPSQLTIGDEFTATVRLKNSGIAAVLVPATSDGGQLRGVTSAEQKSEEKYEVADVSFRLATDKQHRLPIFLASNGALFADPDDKNTYLSLAPGNWLDIKLKGAVECGAAKCLGGLQPDSDAVLTAWWYQRVLTHRVSGCEENHGSFDVRGVDSAPFRVAVHGSSKRSEKAPRI